MGNVVYERSHILVSYAAPAVYNYPVIDIHSNS